MRPIIGLLYTLYFFALVTTALFIIFHLMRYSLNRKVALFGTLFFLTVFSILLFTNALIFFSLPIEDFFSISSL
jgi:hypothetical protein